MGFVRPMLLNSPTRLLVAGPDRLTSAADTRDFNEVKAEFLSGVPAPPEPTDEEAPWGEGSAIR